MGRSSRRFRGAINIVLRRGIKSDQHPPNQSGFLWLRQPGPPSMDGILVVADVLFVAPLRELLRRLSKSENRATDPWKSPFYRLGNSAEIND